MLKEKSNTVLLSLYLLIIVLTFFPVFFSDRLELHLNYYLPHNTFSDFLFKNITHLGDGLLAVFIILVVYLFINIRLGFITTFSAVTSGLVTQLLKKVVFSEVYRPWYHFKDMNVIKLVEGVDIHEKFSFPSGHTTTTFALFMAFALYTKNIYLKYLFFIIAFLSGYSRVYLSQHFYIDVYVGSLIGTMFVILGIKIFSVKIPWMEKSIYNIVRPNKNK